MSVSGNENLVEYHEKLLESLCEEEKIAEDHEDTFGGPSENVVYIGDKPKKKISYKGRNYVFFRLLPVPTPAAVATYVLGFKGVFSTTGEMAAELENAQQIKQHHELTAEARRLEEQRHQQQQEELHRTTVRIGSGEIDLGKLTSVQMSDLAEDNGINLDLLPQPPADMRAYLVNHFNRKGKTA